MGFDYITETRRIIGALQSEGAASFAKKVQDAMDCASTSTELLMGVKFHLSEIPPNSISKSLMNQIQVLIKEIEGILAK